MEIADLPIALPATDQTTPYSAEARGFSGVLQAAQAPPGPEPPPPPKAQSGEKEQKTNEPNAQSNKPDLSSNDDPNSPKKVKRATGTHPAPTLPSATIAETLSIRAASAASVKGLAAVPPNGKDVAGTQTAKPADSVQGKVSLNKLPTDPLTQIISAKPGFDLKSATLPQPATSVVSTQPAAPMAFLKAVPGSGALKTEPLAQQSGTALPNPQIPTEDPGIPVGPATAQQTTPQSPQPIATAPAPEASISVQILTPDSLAQAHQPNAQVASGGSGVSTGHGGASPATQLRVEEATQLGAPMQHGFAGGQAGQGQADSNTDASGQSLDVIKEIAAHADKLAALKSTENVTVHLQTEDQASVTLQVKNAHGEVQAQIMTDNAALRNALHQNRPQLAHTLESKGMSMGQVSVGLRQEKGQRQPAYQAARRRDPREASDSTRLAIRTAKTWGVDLWI